MPLPTIQAEMGVFAVELRFSNQGKPWVKVRAVAKDRKRDQSGQWVDGDPLWIDVVAFGDLANNIAESVDKGDSIVVTGRLEQQEWTTDSGEKRSAMRILADTCGVNLRWKPVGQSAGDRGVANAQAGLGGTPVQDNEPPF